MSASPIDLSEDARLGFLAKVIRAIAPHANGMALLLVGLDAHEAMRQDRQALDRLLDILRPELDRDGPLRLVADMPRSTNADRVLRMVEAFHAGLSGKASPFARR